METEKMDQVIDELASAVANATDRWPRAGDMACELTGYLLRKPGKAVCRQYFTEAIRPILERFAAECDRLAVIEGLLGRLEDAGVNSVASIEHFKDGEGRVLGVDDSHLARYGKGEKHDTPADALRSLLPRESELPPDTIVCGTTAIGSQRYRCVLHPIGEEDDAE